MIDFLGDQSGDRSMMRLGVSVCLAIGGSTVISGLVGWFLKYPEAVMVMSVGAGIMGFAMGAKAWQSQAEAKYATTEDNR